MNQEQRQAYEWAKNQDYQSVDARYAKILAGLVDEIAPPNEPLTLISMSDEIPPDNERVLVYRPCMVDSDTGPYSVQWGWAAKRDGSHWARLPDRRPTAEEMEMLEGME